MNKIYDINRINVFKSFYTYFYTALSQKLWIVSFLSKFAWPLQFVQLLLENFPVAVASHTDHFLFSYNSGFDSTVSLWILGREPLIFGFFLRLVVLN